jgi:hypothetical protein
LPFSSFSPTREPFFITLQAVKIVRAEKEGATIGPTHGSRKRHKTSSNIVGTDHQRSKVKLATVPWNPFAMPVVMPWNPVLMFPVRLNPFPVFVVVTFNPNLPARRVGANINGCEAGQKRQADTENQQFHSQFLIPF